MQSSSPRGASLEVSWVLSSLTPREFKSEPSFAPSVSLGFLRQRQLRISEGGGGRVASRTGTDTPFPRSRMNEFLTHYSLVSAISSPFLFG